MPQLVDNNDNLILQIDTLGEFGISNLGLIKLNPQNELIYRRSFSQHSLPYIFDYTLSFINANNDVIVSGGYQNSYIRGIGTIVKLDSAANIQWQKMYRTNNQDEDCYIRQTVAGSSGDIVALIYSLDLTKPYKLVLLDSTGNIKWAKAYSSTITNFRALNKAFIIFNRNEIMLFGQFSYSNDKKNGFFLSKVNYADGKVISTRSLSLTSNIQNTVYNIYHELKHFNYNGLSRKYMIDLYPDYRFFHGFVCIVTDSSLNEVSAKIFDFNVINPLGNTLINSLNQLTFCWSRIADTSLLYAVINENLELVSQKKISLKNYPVNPRNYRGQAIFKKNGLLNIEVGSLNYSTADNFLLLKGSPFYNVNNSCLGNDMTFLSSQSTPLSSLNIVITESEQPIQSYNLPVMVPENKTLTVHKYCEQKSICDTIKISGQQTHCLDSSVATFTLYKNPQCLRKTEWHVDTSAVQIISKPDDTTLNVRFLKSFHGYLFANFGGCSLKDSFRINVFKPKLQVNLGKDTMYCPGKALTLHAGTGYKNYTWQDGSTNEFFNASAPGLYNVSVTDSCGNTSHDSIFIKPFDATLNVDFPAAVCLYDTAKIVLPVNLINYEWIPNVSANLKNRILYLYPTETSLYTIKGERFSGCAVSDTVLIKIKNCPVNIYFPNSFTPNNDGLNDAFKPLVDGHLISYDLSVYNRWGQLVFKTNDFTHGWNGNTCLTGVYVWLCQYKFMNQLPMSIKGIVVLMR